MARMKPTPCKYGRAYTKKYDRFRPSTMALRESRPFQQAPLIPVLPFARLVRQIARHLSTDIFVESTAIDILHEGAEAYIVSLFQETLSCASYAKHAVIMSKDLHLARRIRGE